MDVFVSVDMEGIAGVTTSRQVTRGSDDYPLARTLIEEANAAIAGAFDGGAARVVVSDPHGDMGNLLADRIDPRAELIVGTPKLPRSMMTGMRDGFACALLVGYHAGGGVEAAVMDHTFTVFFADVRVNGEPWNETHLNAALAGTFGVPVARPEPAFAIEVDLTQTTMAELAWLAPGTERIGPRTFRFEHEDFREAMRAFLGRMWLTRTIAPTGKAD